MGGRNGFYVTSADSWEEAEEKFLDEFKEATIDDYTIDMEPVDRLKTLDATFF